MKRVKKKRGDECFEERGPAKKKRIVNEQNDEEETNHMCLIYGVEFRNLFGQLLNDSINCIWNFKTHLSWFGCI